MAANERKGELAQLNEDEVMRYLVSWRNQHILIIWYIQAHNNYLLDLMLQIYLISNIGY